MNLDDLSLRMHALLRKAGLERVSPHVLIGSLIIGIMLVLFALWHFWPRANADFISSQAIAYQTASVDGQNEPTPKSEIVVDVEGAVMNPGLCTLEPDARIGEAINAAGGLTEDAVEGSLNLAQKLSDGDQIIVPNVNDAQAEAAAPATGSAGGDAQGAAGKVNINTASAEELQRLSGVGPALSQRIIEYREANGRFQTIEGLKKVSGIGDAKYASIKDKICL